MTSPHSASQAAAGSSPGPAVTAAVLLLASMTIMANATIAPSLPGLKDHFAGTPGIETLLGLVITLPSAMIVLTAGLIGSLSDRYDRRPMLVFFGLCFALGGASGLWVDTLTGLLIGRAVLGIGVAGTMTLALAFGSEFWEGPARARYMGQQGAAMSAGGVVVMVLGGALAGLGWRGAFAIYLAALPIALNALWVLGTRLKREPHGHEARPGAPKEGFPWGVYAFTGTLAFVFMALFYVMPTRLPFLMLSHGTANPMVVGAVMGSMTLAMMPGSLAYGRVRARLSPMAIFALGFGLMAVGLGIIASVPTLAGTWTGVIVGGLGMGPMMPNFITYLMGFVPPTQQGRASGLLTTALFAGQFCSPLVSAPLVTAFGLEGGFLALAVAMAAVFAGLGVLAARPRLAMA